MRLHIRDTSPDAQRFPLSKLSRVVINVTHLQPSDTVVVSKASGYGLDVCALDDQTLKHKTGYCVPVSSITAVLSDSQQWFYDLAVRDPKSGLSFGIDDSSFLFVEGDDYLVREIGIHFERATIHP